MSGKNCTSLLECHHLLNSKITRSSHKLDIYQWKTIWDIWLNYRKTNQFFKFIMPMELYHINMIPQFCPWIKFTSNIDQLIICLILTVDVDYIKVLKNKTPGIWNIAIVCCWLDRALIISRGFHWCLVEIGSSCSRAGYQAGLASTTTRMEEMRLSRNLQPRSPRRSFKFLKANS